MSEYVLELNGITKTFPGVRALDKVNFKLKAGEIHALMGENGAGKSTFIKVITGVHAPDEGEIILNGKVVDIKNPNNAQAMGIAAIYQHGNVYPDLTVTENIFLGHEKIEKWTKRILWNEMHEDAKKLLDELGASFEPKTKMGALSVAQQQLVEIAKALSSNAKIIIMDEPTAALSRRESEELYRITEKLRDDGAAIIFISHRFEDMYRLASRVTVFRDSNYIGTWKVDEITNQNLIMAMVGREISQLFPKKQVELGEEVLRVEGFSKAGYFADISFAVHKGEIVGLTGLVGAGRSELCQTIFGIMKPDSGSLLLNGKEIKVNSPVDAMNYGIGYLPEDRQRQGLVLSWGIGENITLPILEKFSKSSGLDVKKERAYAKLLAEKVDVKANSIFTLASQLSGGNQQKVVVAKMLAADLKIIILDEPTKGVDVGAKAAMYEIMSDLASQGYAIIMISSEMPEMIGMSDRIVVMRNGRISRIINREDATQEKILEAAMSTAGKKS
ncbi:sugar ABC transporter ATP-binding protein [Clostridium lacusfryxellense]|uniref:sugar ABC transporter ATP-binding protein n=1 Tax=Clostridium lacusfryxellense TaxID=205328 RepID=UPI001C0CD594|nr:sugar ABC transporter ATP-binding protein [Clostridium lacusfryxellense]MBU3112739.1 sugar ABC transporter ATP-binding protein [Clostridium lacusfryxellense]